MGVEPVCAGRVGIGAVGNLGGGVAVGVCGGGGGGSAWGVHVSGRQGAGLRLEGWVACQLAQVQQRVAGMASWHRPLHMC